MPRNESDSADPAAERAPRSHRRHRVLTPAISMRRRVVVLLLFLFLVAAIYVWHSLTDREKIQQMARDYLEGIVADGARVTVRDASFDVFEGVWLHGVQIRLSGDPKVASADGRSDTLAVLSIGSVHLRHQPASLLVGRYVPTEITVSELLVSLVERVEAGRWNVQDLLKPAGMQPGGGSLPIIRVRGGHIRFYRFEDGELLFDGEQGISGHVSPDRQAGGHLQFRFDLPFAGEQGPPDWVKGELDPATDQVRVTGGTVRIRGRMGMPRRVGSLIEMFSVRGPMDFVKPEAPAGQDSGSRIEAICSLRGVSARVPVAGVSVAVHGVTGQVHFTGERIRFENIHGYVEGVPFVIPAGWVGMPGEPAGRPVPISLHVDIQDAAIPAVLGGRLARLMRLLGEEMPGHHELRTITGIVDGSVDLRGDAPASCPAPAAGAPILPLAVDADLHLRNGSFTSRLFPYPVDGLTGHLVYRNGALQFDHVQGRHGPTSITSIDGRLAHLGPTAGMDMTIRASDVEFDEDLLQALNPQYGSAVRALNPEGRFDLGIHLVRPEGQDDEPRIDGDITLHGAAIRCEQVGWPLENLAGTLHIDGDRIRIERDRPLRFSRGQMAGTLSGDIQTAADCRFHFALAVEHVPLADLQTLAAAEPYRESIRTLHLGGSAGIDADVRGALASAEPPEFVLTARLDGAQVNDARFPYPLTGVTGKVTIYRDRIELADLRAEPAGAKIGMSGRVNTLPEDRSVDLTLTGEGVPADPALRDALPATARRVWEALNPSGRFDCRLHVTADRTGGPLQMAGTIRPVGASVKYTELPYELTDLHGQAELSADGAVHVRSISGKHGGAAIHIDDGWIRPRGEQAEVDLTLSGEGIPIDEDLRRALPWAVRRQWGDLKPTGSMDLGPTRIVFKPTDGPGGTAYLTLDLRPKDLGLQLAGRAEGVTGTIRLEIEYHPGDGRHGLRGTAALTSARYMKVPLTDVKASLESLSSDNCFRIRDLEARAYDGLLAGGIELRFRPDDTYYEAELAAKGVKLPQLAAQLFGEQFPYTGAVSGTVKIDGRMKAPAQRRMEANLLVDKAELFQLPAIINVLRFLNLRKPEQLSFQEASIRCNAEGDRLRFDEIHLRGKALVMLGAGTFDLASREVHLALVVGPPENLPRVPLLEDIVKGLQLALTQVEVTGNIDKPQVRSRPFSDLAEEIRDLLRRQR